MRIPQPLWKNPNVQNAAAVLTGLAILYKLPAVIRNYDHHLIYFFGVMVHLLPSLRPQARARGVTLPSAHVWRVSCVVRVVRACVR